MSKEEQVDWNFGNQFYYLVFEIAASIIKFMAIDNYRGAYDMIKSMIMLINGVIRKQNKDEYRAVKAEVALIDLEILDYELLQHKRMPDRKKTMKIIRKKAKLERMIQEVVEDLFDMMFRYNMLLKVKEVDKRLAIYQQY